MSVLMEIEGLKKSFGGGRLRGRALGVALVSGVTVALFACRDVAR